MKLHHYILVICIPIITLDFAAAIADEILLSEIDIRIDELRKEDEKYVFIQRDPEKRIEVDRRTFTIAMVITIIDRVLLIPLLVSFAGVGGVIVYMVLSRSIGRHQNRSN